MGIVRLGVPSEMVLQLKDRYHIRNFVETGTYQGWTAHWASQHFERVITIELAKPLYDYAKSTYRDVTNIEFLYGDTRDQLRAIVPTLDSPSLFWLDAHWSGGVTYGETDECPLADELEIINRSPFDHFILIDDARLFLSPPPHPHRVEQWIDISTLITLVNASIHEKYTVINEDVVVIVPKSAKPIIAGYYQDLNTQAWEKFCNQANSRRLIENSFPQLSHESLTMGEVELIKRLTLPGRMIFDVGANIGTWTKTALTHWSNATIHLFEPTLKSYHSLLQYFADFLPTEQIIPNSMAIAHQSGLQTFYVYDDAPAWNTLHRRVALEEKQELRSHPISVLAITLEQYCQQMGISRINFLKVDVEGGELNVLLGARQLLVQGKIDYIQFEYGGAWKDANTSLEQAFQYLQTYNYGLFKIQSDSLYAIANFLPDYEDFEFSNYLAVHPRFLANFLEEFLPDLQQLCIQHSIESTNILHIGAHLGNAIDTYQRMQIEGVLFVEANPVIFEQLEHRLVGVDSMLAVQCAVGDRVEPAVLHIASDDRFSSLLPLEQRQTFYPDNVEEQQIEVSQVTLDYLLEDLQLDPAEFNTLVITVEGTELRVLHGAIHLLPYLTAILMEVNYEEVEPGCAEIDAIDRLLANHEFQRVQTIALHHPSLAQAFYIKKPVVSLSTLGHNGQFANQLFQYMFLKLYAKVHDLRVEAPVWIGQFLFGASDPAVSMLRPTVGSPNNLLPELAESLRADCDPPYKNVDFWGYFQYPTRFYFPHQTYIRSLFQPVPSIAAKLKVALDQLRSHGGTVVGLHLRRKDYGYEHFFIAPSQWYKDWLKGLWETLDQPVLFIASDDLAAVLPDFTEYHPVTSQSLGISLPEAPFYPDFYLLSQCDMLAISNSSFSFAASLLNESVSSCVRPHLPSRQLIPYDPWNSEPLLRDARVEDAIL